MLELLALPPIVVFAVLATYNLVVCTYSTNHQRKFKSPNPKPVSIYVPVFNDHKILSSLSSLSKINYANFRVKILNDSTDERLNESIIRFVKNHFNFSVIRRESREGFKGGAIENALKSEENPYICILDCDFRPPRTFLTKIVAAMELEHADVLQGYQRHIRGSESLLGMFYRASLAASIVFLSGRDRLALAPIFYGSCALLKTDVAKKVGFNSNSITEDLNFSLRAYSEGHFKVSVYQSIYANGSCPISLRHYIKQQLRWCEGTIRDVFRDNFFRILKAKQLRQKTDLIIQGLQFSAGFLLLWSYIATWFTAISPTLGLFLTTWFGLGYAYPLWKGATLEKYNFKSKIKVLLVGFLLIYIMCPVMTYGFLKGMLKNKGYFNVTTKY